MRLDNSETCWNVILSCVDFYKSPLVLALKEVHADHMRLKGRVALAKTQDV